MDRFCDRKVVQENLRDLMVLLLYKFMAPSLSTEKPTELLCSPSQERKMAKVPSPASF